MDEKSGESKDDGVIHEGIDVSEVEKLVPK